MKLSERLDIDDHMVHITQKHDVAATLKRAEMMRQARDAGHYGSIPKDWKPIATVPAVMVRDWVNQAGLQMHDTEAVQDLLEKKLASGEFSRFIIEKD